MTENEIIIECAKLDGKQWNTRCVGIDLFATNLTYPPKAVGYAKEIKTYGDVRLATEEEIAVSIKRGDFKTLLPAYTTFRDAIVPVIEKQGHELKISVINCLAEMIGIDSDWSEQGASLAILEATPSQLCEALLRATGKWKD